MEKGAARAQLPAMADGAADDAAQVITAPFVARDHAVGNQEGTGADVVGQHAERGAVHVGVGCFTRGGSDQRLEQIYLVIGMDTLQHRRNAFKAHAGIDRGLGQRMHDAGLVAVELHEDVVPDFDVAVAVLILAARRTAPDMLAVVIEDFGAGSAGPCLAHHPEIVRGIARTLVVADANDARRRYADLVGPDLVSLVVFGVHRDPELVRRQFEDVDQQFPGVLDGIALEIVAKAEVAQHLEKGVMARRITDVFKVVVLAARAHTFLRRRGAVVAALVEAEEHILELVHPGVGEQQGRILVRHQRTGGHDLVAFRREEIEESLADFGAFHGGAESVTQSGDFTRSGAWPATGDRPRQGNRIKMQMPLS